MGTVSILKKWKAYRGIFIFFVVGMLFLVRSIQLDLFSYIGPRGIQNIWLFLNDAVPPDMALLPLAGMALLETVEIAFLGTILGAFFSFPLALLASRNICPYWITFPTRVFLASVRTLPALLWAVLFVIIVGLGIPAGIFAIACYTVGYLSKLMYEAIEGTAIAPIEAVTALGANKLQQIRFVILPENANYMISQLLFMFEYNIRASSIVGFVGAGGIGFYMMGYLKFLNYDKVFTLLLVIFVAVMILDAISVFFRDKYVQS